MSDTRTPAAQQEPDDNNNKNDHDKALGDIHGGAPETEEDKTDSTRTDLPRNIQRKTRIF